MDTLHVDKLDARLADHIKGIDLQSQSRVPALRLSETAIPNIGLIELVSGEVFERDYQSLYLSMFHGGERERPDLIVQRLLDAFAGLRSGLAPYRVIGIRDFSGSAIGAAQFSVLMLSGAKCAVPYLQYIYVRPENRRQDVSEVLHTMVLAIAIADGISHGYEKDVPFTLFETEPPNHGTSQSSRTNATQRTAIHTKSGSRAIMLVDKFGRFCSSHVQPGLEPRDRPITLVWVVRPSPGVGRSTPYDVNVVGTSLLAAYYQSLRDEGFPEDNIALAEDMARKRCHGRTFVEMPLADITADMYRDLEVESAP